MLILAIVLGALLISCAKREQKRFEGRTMGTTWRVTLASPAQSPATESLQHLLQQRLDELDGIFSNWRSDSPLSRFNDSRITGWQSVPRELVEMVKFSLEISEKTNGAYDVTAAPLIDLWGFGAHGRITEPPSESLIQQTRARCDWRKLEVKMNPPSLKKAIPDLEINVCSMAEGYAADDLARILRENHVENFLIEVAGAVVASGKNASGEAWHVGIQKPNAEQGVSAQVATLNHQALSTSGVYRQFFEYSGQHYPHVLDARTGRPITHHLQSVSVMADSCFFADGWDTALLILGPEEGRTAAEKNGINAIFLSEEQH